MRHCVVVLGDQLDAESSAWDGFDPMQDVVWMAEVMEESTHVRSHLARSALFLSAMRHFRDALKLKGWTVHYRELDERGNQGSLESELSRALVELKPARVIRVEAGDWRVEQQIRRAIQSLGIEEDVRVDRHFLCTREEFAVHVNGRKQLRMEFFYREMRRRHDVLMDGDQPLGGEWNFDAENRESFGKAGPGPVGDPVAFPPDATTQEVLRLVAGQLGGNPGSLAGFDWAVTREQALVALMDFIRWRLPEFGRYQDAMWGADGAGSGERSEAELNLGEGGSGRGTKDGTARRNAYLYHSRLSAALNLKLLHPREVIRAAEDAHRAGQASLASVEGFIRQILGWREYVRGIYGRFMPEYADRNALGASEPLPWFYWTGRTDMNCLAQVIRQTLALGYAHHIQRLMVTGLFALLLGVRPRSVHEWYLAVYVDAVEWVELPNTIGMSQYADDGFMASKPYCASGKYIERMSNACAGCRFDPAKSVGKDACPYTTLYWDFLMRHEARFARHPRTALQWRNLVRLGPAQRQAIAAQAQALREALR